MRLIRLLATFMGVLVCHPSSWALTVNSQADGQVVVCGNSGSEQYRSLAFYEGENFQSAFPNNEPWVFDKVRWALSQVEKFHPNLIKGLKVQLELMAGQFKAVKKDEDLEISGNGWGGLPINCHLAKAVFRLSGDNSLVGMNEKLWKHLAAQDQAGLILEALVVREVDLQHLDLPRQQLRSLVRSWSQGGAQVLGIDRYVRDLQGSEKLISSITIKGVDYRLDPNYPLQVYPNGQVAKGTLADAVNSYVYKSENGFSLEIGSQRGPIQLQFHSTGVPRSALLKSEVVEIPIQGRKLKFRHEVSFYPNGQVKRGFFMSEFGLRLRMSDGRFRRFKRMEYHLGIFDSSGNLLSARRLSHLHDLSRGATI